MSITEIILISILIIISLLLITIISFGIFIINEFKKELEYNRLEKNLELNLNYKISDEDFKAVDTIIAGELNKYTLLNIDPTSVLHITEDMQNTMIREILKGTLSNLSPLQYDRLKYIYKEDKLQDLICEKVKFSVMDYVIQFNGQYNDK